jgi:hypothetical protein
MTLGRLPTTGELNLATAFLKNATDESEESRREAWAQIFQSLFASVDFRYLN